MAQLTAKVGDQVIWDLSLLNFKDGGELIFVNISKKNRPIKQILNKNIYEVLLKLSIMASKDFLHKKNQASYFLSDEPSYQLKLDGHLPISVAFKFPEICEILSSGDLQCKKILLSPAEKLLLKLQNFALAMKSQVQ